MWTLKSCAAPQSDCVGGTVAPLCDRIRCELFSQLFAWGYLSSQHGDKKRDTSPLRYTYKYIAAGHPASMKVNWGRLAIEDQYPHTALT